MADQYTLRGDLADNDNYLTRNFPVIKEARQAKQFARGLPPEFGALAEGKRDAARHMFWMAEISRQYHPMVAKAAGWGNEALGALGRMLVPGLLEADIDASRRMDDHNNALGVQIGLLSNSPEATRQLILDALQNAELDPEAQKQTSAPIYRKPAPPPAQQK